jgi:hypothetical protein
VELDQLAHRLAALDDAARRVSRHLRAADDSLGGGGPGRLGEVGRALVVQHRVAIDKCRADTEAAGSVVERLTETLSAIAANYRELESRRTARITRMARP